MSRLSDATIKLLSELGAINLWTACGALTYFALLAPEGDHTLGVRISAGALIVGAALWIFATGEADARATVRAAFEQAQEDREREQQGEQ